MAGTLVIDTLKSSTTSPPTFQNTNGTEIGQLCRAWVSFNGSTAVIGASYNVSSVTRSAAGSYVVSYTSAFANTNYCVVASARGQSDTDANTTVAGPGVLSLGSSNIFTKNNGNTLVDSNAVYVSVFR